MPHTLIGIAGHFAGPRQIPERALGWAFFRDARNEVRKVIWPTRQETLQTTLIVLAMVVLVALILWAMDALFLELVQWLVNLNRGS